MWYQSKLFRLRIAYYTFCVLTLLYVYRMYVNHTDTSDSTSHSVRSKDRKLYQSRIGLNDTSHHPSGGTQNAGPGSIHAGLCDSECVRKKELFYHVHCDRLLSAQPSAQAAAGKYLAAHPNVYQSDSTVLKRTQNCREYKATNAYPEQAHTPAEDDFPIAYSIVVHKNVYQLEKLLQAIYWPQNWYCVHVDKKSSSRLIQTVDNLANCFPNVITPSRRESVMYASFSRLKADLNCMDELLRRNRSWRYVINLTGQEYPLKTNGEIVNILKMYNGSNDIEGKSQKTTLKFFPRFFYHWDVVDGPPPRLVKDFLREKHTVPGNLTIVKGSAFGAFSRAFIEYVFTDALVQQFLDWVSDTYSPDEIFWATVNARAVNPVLRSPGGCVGDPEDHPWLVKYVSWPPRDQCRGITKHTVCIFSYKDLPNLISQRHLFANKFSTDYDYIVLDCLEQWMHNKTLQHTSTLDYRSLTDLNSNNKKS